VLGPTGPNRLFAVSGTIDPTGNKGGPDYNNNGLQAHKTPNFTAYANYAWETYAERLDRAGISWRNYCFNADPSVQNLLTGFVQFQNAPSTSSLFAHGILPATIEEFLEDIRTSNVPQVSWITAPESMWEHPATGTPAAGQNFVGRVLNALWSNPKVWAKSLFILHYDENDGLFDHVVPPTPEPGTPDEFLFGQPIGLGFRVPCILISPFTRGGYVCSETFDHTSTLMLLERRFGVEVANVSAWRRRTCGDMTVALGLGATPYYDVPKLPDTELALSDLAFNLPKLPSPIVPSTQAMPAQEAGQRKRRGKA
jgi:phospholipase C